MRSWLGVAWLVVLAGCGVSFRPVINEAEPLNGSTAVDIRVQPRLRVARSTSIDATQRHVVLQNISTGGRTVAGTIEISDQTLVYQPHEPLAANQLYELAVDQTTVSGEKLLDVDDTEQPPEELRWPYRLRFYTGSAPSVRAVYLDENAGRQRLTIRFSQRMEQVVTTAQIGVLDASKNAVPFDQPVWIDDRSVRLDLRARLEGVKVYTLQIQRQAQGADGALFDGNGNGKPGEVGDDFSVQFTGTQTVVLSRLVATR